MFRGLNERIRLLVAPFEAGERRLVPFVCECRDEHCFAPVAISIAEFDAICANDGHRLIALGHRAQGEQAVLETATYAVVRIAEVGEDGFRGTARITEGRETPASSSGPSAGASRHDLLCPADASEDCRMGDSARIGSGVLLREVPERSRSGWSAHGERRWDEPSGLGVRASSRSGRDARRRPRHLLGRSRRHADGG